MYQTSANKTTAVPINRMAFIWLKTMGFPLANIRKAFGKLTGISQAEIARQSGVKRLTVAKNVTGERRQAEVQRVIADAWGLPVEVAFEAHNGDDDGSQQGNKEQSNDRHAH